MTRLAIWNADSLLGGEIKDGLAQRRDLWDDLRLLTDSSDDLLVTDIGEEAALVQPATPDNLDDVDLLFFCAETAERAEIPEIVPADLATIVVAGDAPIAGVPPVVAGVNATPSTLTTTVASAHPALVALAQLLWPLAPLGLRGCTASVVLPCSILGQDAIDQLLDQARSILAFQPQAQDEIFGYQLAFNLVPGPLSGQSLVDPLRTILADSELELAIQASLGGFFHAISVGVHVRLDPGIDQETVREALEGSPVLEFAAEPRTLGPVAVAGSATMQLGTVEPSSAPGGFWLRAVMDNLTLGGAHNAIGIAEATLAARASDPDYTM